MSVGATAEHFVPLHMYAVVSIFVLYTHIGALLFRKEQGADFWRVHKLIVMKRARESSLHAS